MSDSLLKYQEEFKFLSLIHRNELILLLDCEPFQQISQLKGFKVYLFTEYGQADGYFHNIFKEKVLLLCLGTYGAAFGRTELSVTLKNFHAMLR